MEDLIKGILDRMRNSFAYNGPYKEWRVTIGQHFDGKKDEWLAHLLNFDPLTGAYTLVQSGDPETTAYKAVARLDRRVELLVYTVEGHYNEWQVEVARKWQKLQHDVAHYGEASGAARQARDAWKKAMERLAFYDAPGAPQKAQD